MGRVEYLGGIVYIISLGLLDSKMVILLVFIELYIDWNHLNGRKSVVAFAAIAFLARHTTMSRSYWEYLWKFRHVTSKVFGEMLSVSFFLNRTGISQDGS